MIIGLIGASRTGKTTLAKKLAEDLSLHYHATSITASAKRHGYDPVAPMDLMDRVSMQVHLLDDFLADAKKFDKITIVDRTPVDFCGYLLGEFHMQSHLLVDPAITQAATVYVENCIQAMNKLFSMAIVCRPLGHYEVEAGKPAFNPAYQLHTQTIMEGVGLRVARTCKIVALDSTELDHRVEIASAVISRRLDELDVYRRTDATLN